MIECPTCEGTGYEALESSTGGMVETPCTCAMGHAVSAPLIGPKRGTSHQLGELAIDRHRAAMSAEDMRECWSCNDWHKKGETCPAISGGGWIAPEFHKQGATT